MAAEKAMLYGAVIVIEWPQQCDYWRESCVIHFMTKHCLVRTHVHGCAYGLVSRFGNTKGMPIKKPWSLAINDPKMRDALYKTCDRQHEHAPCAGRDTRETEGYTDLLVDKFTRRFSNIVIHCKMHLMMS